MWFLTQPPQRQYIGQYDDSESDLAYLNARYYDSGRGQFTSQDPVFWEIAQTPDGVRVLQNPQAQNSYTRPCVYMQTHTCVFLYFHACTTIRGIFV